MERINAKIDKSKVDFFIATNANKFDPASLMAVRDTISQMNDDQFLMLQAANFRDPTLILILAIFTGWERLFIDDVGLGVLKILTCYGLGIWWLVDMFTAIDRAQRYNYNRFMHLVSLSR